MKVTRVSWATLSDVDVQKSSEDHNQRYTEEYRQHYQKNTGKCHFCYNIAIWYIIHG